MYSFLWSSLRRRHCLEFIASNGSMNWKGPYKMRPPHLPKELEEQHRNVLSQEIRTEHFLNAAILIHFLHADILFFTAFPGARGSVVGWGTMLQAGRSPGRVPVEVDLFSLPNSASRTMALGLTEPLTEMSTRNLPGGKKRPAHRADNLAAICELNVWKCGSLHGLHTDCFTFTLRCFHYAYN
jgi:hypothetical protein